jgi:hypothetical protein
VNAQETITAAIQKLETLKAETTPAPWHYWTDDLNGDVDLWHDQERRHWIANLGRHEDARVYRDADLIVTMHRAIDPVLMILRDNVGGAHDFDIGATPDDPYATKTALALAHAILGDPS